MKTETNAVSTVTQLIFLQGLLAQAIEHSRHPARVAEIEHMISQAIAEFKIHVGGHMLVALDYFDGGMLEGQMNRKTYLSNAARMRIARRRKS